MNRNRYGYLRVLSVAALLLACSLVVEAAVAFRAAASALGQRTTLTYISYCVNDNGSGGGSALTLTANSGQACSVAAPAAGDLLIAHVAIRGNAAITAPSGWTLIRSDSNANITQVSYWKVATSAADSGTWSFASSVRASGAILAFRYADNSAPISASGGTLTATDSATVTAPSQNQTVANSMLVALFSIANGNATPFSTVGGMTEAYEAGSRAGQNGIAIAADYLLDATTGNTGDKVSSVPSTNPNLEADKIGQLLVIKPISGFITIPVPSGTLTNDVMVATVAYRDRTLTISPPAGWTLVNTVTQVNGGRNGMVMATYYRVATAAEPASYTWTFPDGTFEFAVGGINSYSGVDTAAPINAQAVRAEGNGTTRSFTTPTITPSVNGAMLVGAFAYNSADSWTPPATFTESVDVRSPTATNATGITLELVYKVQATAAAVSATATAGSAVPSDYGATMLLALKPGVAGPDHYELSVPSGSVSCQATTVTVTACANNSSPCTSTYAGASGYSATLSLGAAGPTLGSTTVTFNASGVATTTLAYPSAADGAAVTVILSGETLGATNARRCCTDGTTCALADRCSTTFKTAGFIFADAINGAQATIANQTAGTSSATYYLRAVRTNTSTKACEAALVGANTVNMGYQCNNPTTCSGSNLMSINGGTSTTIARNDNGSFANTTAVPMTFDANGNAPFTLNYGDVGQVTLYAVRSAGATSGGTLLSALSGTSNAFVVKPGGFTVTNIKQTAAPQTANPAAADASGAQFVMAGESFSATVTATTSSGVVTPNFGRETNPEGVLLTPTLVAPAGGSAGTLSNGTVGGVGVFNNGAATVNNLAWSEVGIITLTPRVGDGDYLGAGDVIGTTTGHIGRFYPAQFAISATSLTHACPAPMAPTPFTYFGEDGFSTGFTLTAQNTSGATTTNYTGAFAKLDLSSWGNYGFTAATLPAGSTLSSSATAPSGTWNNGVASVTARHQISRPTTLTGETHVTVSAAPTDGEVPASATATALGSVRLRYGRLQLLNAYGSELLALPMTLRAQYWNGSAWVTNTDDHCTPITAPTAGAGLTFYPEVAAGTAGNHLSAGETTASVNASGKLASGNAGLRFSAPGAGNSGYVDVSIGLAARPWLRFPWAGAGDVDPSGRATFGIYKSRLIYSRENY